MFFLNGSTTRTVALKSLIFASAILHSAGGLGTAKALTLFDSSPALYGLVGASTAGNVAPGQFFVARFSLAATYDLTGIDTYGTGLNVGSPVQVLIYDNGFTGPGSLLAQINSTVSQEEAFGGSLPHERYFATFSQTLGAGTYWINVVSPSISPLMSILLVNSPTPATAIGNQIAGPFGVYANAPNHWDQVAMRLYGDASVETPIPGGLPLFATGLGIIGLLVRRHRRKGIAATAWRAR